MNKKIMFMLAVIIAIFLVMGSASAGIFDFLGGDSNTVEPGSELTIAASPTHGGEPEAGFDPLTGWATENGAEPLIQSRILKKDTEGKLINDLASDYTVSDDLKTVDVTLRDDVKFTDNTTLTAKDIEFTYNKAKENAVIDLSSMKEVKATDDTHVQFTLEKPDSTFVHKLAQIGIVPADSYNNETYGTNPIGSGPYKLVQWDKGQQAIFEVNENYYGDMPHYEKITDLFMDSDAAFRAGKAGEADVIEIDPQYANETIEGMHTVIYPSVDMRGFYLPVTPETGETSEMGSPIGNNVTSDIAIRQALSVGINRQEILDNAFNGLGNLSVSGIGAELPWAQDETIENGDLDKAKEILADGGWKDIDNDGILEKDGKTASFIMSYRAGNLPSEAMALQISEQAKEMGINITPSGKSTDQMMASINTDPMIWAYGSTDPYSIYCMYDSEMAHVAFNNPGSYNNSAVDDMINKAMSEDLESSYDSWSQVPKLAEDDVPWIWVGSIDYVFFVSDDVDFSEDTHTIYPHGGDVWGNVCDWKPVK